MIRTKMYSFMGKWRALLLVGFLSFLSWPLEAQAQLLRPAKWEYELSASQWKVGDVLELHLRGLIEPDWYIYASDFSIDGPDPTQLQLDSHASYNIVGKLRSPGRKKKYDPIFKGEYTYFSDTALFVQSLKVSSEALQFTGRLTYQLCSTVSGQCVRFEDEISLKDFLEPRQEEPQADGGGQFAFFLIAFLAGLAGLLTPCVFPLIPMTVTYFTEHAGGRYMALLYGFFIVLIYVLIGSILTPFMGAGLANEIATGWIPNVLFFAVFTLFGLSFLGMFDLVLPYQWATLTESKTNKKGLLGIFFMALTLVLVTFSCTGPIVGSILVQAAGGWQLKPVVGMLGYSLAFALPFSLFAWFPKALSMLPASGGWLNTVKVTLGFLELALALKFLSVADQAYHWGILDREVYISLWIVIFGLLGLYLLGKIRLPKDKRVEHLGVARLLLALLVFAFVVYLVPGMFGAPLKALSGYLPPQSTHDFDLTSQRTSQRSAFRSHITEIEAIEACEEPLYGDILQFPHGLQGYFDYNQALFCARKVGKPLFVAFTGHGCVNCREMEARVWSDRRILERLQKDYVLLALYVDDRTKLSEDAWYVSSYDEKTKKTMGKQNADLQIRRFNNNAQPYYLILGQSEEVLVPPRTYDLSINGFLGFLEAGRLAYLGKYPPPKGPSTAPPSLFKDKPF